jgi:hypothetical protein
MRKKIITAGGARGSVVEQAWLNLEQQAQVEVTSESAEYPIESALLLHVGAGWRAKQPGEQIIRLVFDEALTVTHILLEFHETQRARTQELVLRWQAQGEQSWREIVRQQYNFSPPDTTRELEEYDVALNALARLELRIVPDISGGDACASLARLRLA